MIQTVSVQYFQNQIYIAGQSLFRFLLRKYSKHGHSYPVDHLEQTEDGYAGEETEGAA